MKVFNIVFSLIFILSAALQYNDPDPYIWVPIYLYGAWFCFQAFRRKYYPKAYLAGIIIYAIYALYLWFDNSGVMSWYSEHNAENIVQSMKATKPWIEETREFGGLLLLIIALGINYVVYRKHSSIRL
ncbi:transmembrane 220 family protein [Pedobacter aquatilis]|uniref:transmembrane 220 family protein n=1 Tax=Pedobacter aquatilis TaxID=351343 RepID=UPI0025B2A287|nr:transmembrane 220 family protein [Pedobacter aquatilis]MDN3586493.1 transmembrane 220 family protein [Pedobacter aquatilis]